MGFWDKGKSTCPMLNKLRLFFSEKISIIATLKKITLLDQRLSKKFEKKIPQILKQKTLVFSQLLNFIILSQFFLAFQCLWCFSHILCLSINDGERFGRQKTLC